MLCRIQLFGHWSVPLLLSLDKLVLYPIRLGEMNCDRATGFGLAREYH